MTFDVLVKKSIDLSLQKLTDTLYGQRLAKDHHVLYIGFSLAQRIPNLEMLIAMGDYDNF